MSLAASWGCGRPFAGFRQTLEKPLPGRIAVATHIDLLELDVTILQPIHIPIDMVIAVTPFERAARVRIIKTRDDDSPNLLLSFAFDVPDVPHDLFDDVPFAVRALQLYDNPFILGLGLA